MTKIKRKLIYILTIALFVLIFILSIPALNSDEFKEFVESMGIFGPLVIILYYIIADVIAPLAATPVVVLSQTMFGIYNTLLYVYIGSVLSAAICFYISQHFGRKLVLKLTGQKTMKEIDEFTQVSGTKFLILGRLFGSAINEIISYAYGLTNYKFKKFFLITLLISPIPYLVFAILFRYFNFSATNSILIWIGGFLVVGAAFSYFIKKSSRLNRKPMKKVIMLHGWFVRDISDMPEFLPDSEANWMGWAKKELEKKGYNSINPFLRYGYEQEYEEWKKEIEKLSIDGNTILVGWSSGGTFWIRWLGETQQKIKKLILVAPANVNDQTDEIKKEIESEKRPQPWGRFHDFETDSTIKERVKDGIIIFVSDDAEWLIKSAHIYVQKFGAKLIKIENQGHFENHRRPEPEFPELLNEILK